MQQSQAEEPSFQVVEAGGSSTLLLGESVTLDRAEELQAALLELSLEGRRVVVDAARVKSLHSGILQLLLAAGKAASGLRVKAASREFAEACERLGLDGWLSRAQRSEDGRAG